MGWARTNRAQPICMCWLALSPCLSEPAHAEKGPAVTDHRALLRYLMSFARRRLPHVAV